MEVSTREKEYLKMLEKRFEKPSFCIFVKDLLNLTNDNLTNAGASKPTSEQYKNYIDTIELYAKYRDNHDNDIGVIIIKLQDGKNPANARTLQRNYIAHMMDYYNLTATIAVFYSDTDDYWRLSFVKQETKIEVGKVKTEVSPAKRYSYLFGENEPNHTAQTQLLMLLHNNEKQYSIEEIEEVFSVEKVVDDFFKHYKEKYLQVQEMLENNKDFKTESERCGFTSEEFTKKLLGQIVFIYFLQKKGWLGVKLVPGKLSKVEYVNIYNNVDSIAKKILEKFYTDFNGGKIIKAKALEEAQEQESEKLSNIFVKSQYDEAWGLGNKKFLRKIFDNCKSNNKNFFDDYLEPFFYNGLNHKRANQYFARFNCKIPFLNGGLFEPLDNYDWEISTFNIENTVFSNDNKDGILDIFDTYNFTMNEEEPLEKEVAIDPEMLGKIFENLLEIKDRKSKGAFYTPREIVHYMCQESIANFLVNKVGVKYEEIKELIQYGEMIKDLDSKVPNYTTHLLGDSVFEKIREIDKALENIKVADPAVGSGAFPLGILNEIVKLRDIITTYMIIYNETGRFDKKYATEQIINKRDIYNLKWNAIKNSIYAVDIENSAIDITKLRLWLSIVVDQNLKENEEPQPLPNLDCKIMQGNSLVDEFAGIKLINDDLIERAKTNFIETSRKKGNQNQLQLFEIKDNSNTQIEIFADEKKEIVKDLIKAKSDLYGTNNPDIKKELLKKIDNIRKELFKVNFRASDVRKLNELIEIDNSHNKPYFSWKLEFIEVFVENNGFDIVIGNPPYVDSEHMVKDESLKKTREYCNEHYESAKGNWDLFVIFIELGHLYMGNYGNVSFIIPNKLLASNYAKAIRKMMISYEIQEIRDYSNVNVFKEAAVYPVTFISNNKNLKASDSMKFVMMKNKSEIEWENYVDKEIFKKAENWDTFLSKNIECNYVIEKILSNPKLKDNIAEVKGAATVSEAYSIKDNLYEHEMIDYENEFKFINTGTIDRYETTWHTAKTQYIKQGYHCPVISKKNLKLISVNRLYEASERKIIIGGMTKVLECFLDEGKCLAGKSTVIVYNSKIDLLYLIGILNSKLMSKFYQKYFNSLSLAGGFYRIGAPQIKELPIAYGNKEDYQMLIELVKKRIDCYSETIEKQIDELVYKIYKLTDNEIKILEE